MKILSINYEYPPVGGGGGVACQELNRMLVGKGHTVDVVTSGMKGLPPFERGYGVGIHRVPCIRSHKHYTTTMELITQVYPAYRKAMDLMRTGTYDLNHTHFIVPTGLVSYMLWKNTGLPYIITAHGSDVPGYNPDRFGMTHKIIKPFWTTIVRNSMDITTPSEYLKDLILKNIDVHVSVIPNGYDMATAPMEYERKMNRIILVTRMFERKGVQFFLRAIAGLRTDWEILIAGDGPYLPHLMEEARRWDSPVEFLGFIQGKELVDLYRSAKIFVFPSIQENFPVVLLEAMNAGCAVITTTAPGCREVVGGAAIQVEPCSVESLKESLLSLMHDEGAIRIHSGLSLRRAEKFSWRRVAVMFDAFYKGKMQSMECPALAAFYQGKMQLLECPALATISAHR